MTDAKRVVADGYDAIAERFSKWQELGEDDQRDEWIRRFADLVGEHPRVLEIGSGAGIGSSQVLAEHGALTGVDISLAQVERARKAVPGARFVHADISQVTFPEASFDGVVALYVLTHIPQAELPLLLERVGSWLRPGGGFLATFGTACEEGICEWLGVPMFFSGLLPEANQQLVEQAGLTVVESAVQTTREPEKDVSFHWLLAQKPPAAAA